ncbi:plasma membrane iron permease [Pyrenophora seminiperda CCB06]|uniref:Plasma membrane iron permease n=1 Tax=Pyrenophora seminiperda CCB06 TaxID=1302712 RepID=A0A3M7M8X5_9PLEO|nr:plasma membrane iron permease [Pyrenophora seminiperda CCB06]
MPNCLETSIIVSVLLAFLKQTLGPEHDAAVHKRLVRQIWYGVGAGISICLIICAGVIGTFYTAGHNAFEAAENIWEGVFIAGVGLGAPATSFPLAVICGLGAGAFIGFLIYKGGNKTSLQIFLVVSTCFLYLVAAGLFSKGVWDLEQNAWVKLAGEGVAEAGTGPGSYDIRKSVWHVNCCSPLENGSGGWGIFNSLLGWQNSATYGSVISYNLYWLVVILGFLFLGWKESKQSIAQEAGNASDSSSDRGEMAGKKGSSEGITVATTAREVE